MGYCAHSEESTAFVSSDRVDALIEAAKKSNHDLPSDVDLEDIARAYGFTAEPYDNDTKFTFYFEYGSFYIEVVEDFCSLIAPFVEPGGYISFRGEDDASWAYYFDGSDFKEYTGTTCFPDMPCERLFCMYNPKPDMPYVDLSDDTLLFSLKRMFTGLADQEITEVFDILKEHLRAQPAGIRFSEAITNAICCALIGVNTSKNASPFPGALVNRILSGI